jgi:mRNA interferase HigB
MRLVNLIGLAIRRRTGVPIFRHECELRAGDGGYEFVRVFNSNTLTRYGEKHAGSAKAFRELNRTLRGANWNSFRNVAAAYPSARAIKGSRVVFNVKGNDYRVVGAMDYRRHAVFIKFVGTHAEYDEINAETVDRY